MNNVSQAGYLGWQMVEKIGPVRTAKFDRNSWISTGHMQTVQYIAVITA